MKRRFFLFAAPAIVAAPSLMRVSAAVLDSTAEPNDWLYDFDQPPSLSDLLTETLRNRGPQLAEQITKSNALLTVMRDRNYIYLVDESRLIYKPWRETERRLVTNS